MKFKKASADEVRAKRNSHVKDLSNGTAILKGFQAPSTWNKDTRSAKFIISSESVDRHLDIVSQSGLDTDTFMRNPQALLFHNSRSWPIGQWSDVTKLLSGRPKRTEGVLNFIPEGVDEDADRAARHVQAGSIRTVSIGFIPDWNEIDFILDEDDDWTGGFRYNKSELIEVSLVPVPSNRDAIVKEAGGDMRLAREIIEDILDNYTKTPEGLILPRSEYEAAHKEVSGNPTSVVVRVKVDEDGEFKAVAEQEREEVEASIKAIDETEGLPEATKQTLIQRGMVFCTELKSEEKTFAGYVIAKSHDDAEAIVTERGSGETVLGELTEQRDVESSTKDDVVEHDKAVSEIHIGLHVDGNIEETKKHLEDLEATADRVEKRFEGIFARISKFFGGSEKAIKRIEPEITIEPEVKSPPTEDEISAAKTRAAEIRAKLISKELIAAE